jgi:hypothetical protein
VNVVAIEDSIEAIGRCRDLVSGGDALRGGKIAMVDRRNLGAMMRLKARNVYLLAKAGSDDRNINQAHAI